MFDLNVLPSENNRDVTIIINQQEACSDHLFDEDYGEARQSNIFAAGHEEQDIRQRIFDHIFGATDVSHELNAGVLTQDIFESPTESIDAVGSQSEEDQMEFDSNGMEIEGHEQVETDPITMTEVISSIEEKSLLGLTFECMAECFDFYQHYGIDIGFGVRKSKSRYTKLDGRVVLSTKEFCCSSEGFKRSDNKKEISHEKLDKRTGCHARIRFKLRNGMWVCTAHLQEHIHNFVPRHMRHLLHSTKTMSRHKFETIMALVSAGIRQIDAFRVICNEAGGPQHSGLKKKMLYNAVAIERARVVERGDAQSLINCFNERASTDPDFFFAVEVDAEGRLANFFWRDGQMKIDYKIFGDVVSFDTTYRTNRYNMYCAVIVGGNHHRQNVIFGVAFIVNQQKETFEWLLQTFLHSMDGVQPKTIISDQDASIIYAVDHVLTKTTHRLCLWHISMKAERKLCNLWYKEGFATLFNRWLYDCNTLEEFDQCWQKMVNNFNCSENRWLSSLYRHKQRWAKAFSLDIFSAGVRSTQRSESTNSVLTSLANKQMGLYEVFKAIEKRIQEWRHNELEEDYRNRGAKSVEIHSGLLKHAANIYTLAMFKEFKEKFLKGVCTPFKVLTSQQACTEYSVNHGDCEGRQYIVKYHKNTQTIACTCKLFQQKGILCSHALRILTVNNVDFIPSSYILKRFTKGARGLPLDCNQGSGSPEKLATFCWRTPVMQEWDSLISLSMQDEGSRKIIEEGLSTLKKSVVEYFACHGVGKNVHQSGVFGESCPMVRNPNFVTSNTFGSKRSKSTVEISRRKRRKKTST